VVDDDAARGDRSESFDAGKTGTRRGYGARQRHARTVRRDAASRQRTTLVRSVEGVRRRSVAKLCVLPVAVLPFPRARRYACGDPDPRISLIDRAISTDGAARPSRWSRSPDEDHHHRDEARVGRGMEAVEKRDPMPVGQPAPELRAYLATLWRRKWYIVAVLGVVVPTALFYSSRQTPLYDSTAEVLVRPVNFDPTLPPSAGGFLNMLTEERIASSGAVASIASDRLGGSLPASIEVSSVEGTQSLLFRAVSSDPAAAQKTAQAFARAYLDHRRGEVLADLDAASQPLQDRIAQIDLQLQDVQRQLFEENPSESEKTSLQIQLNSLLTQRGSLEARLNDLVLPENISVGEILQDAPFPFGPFSPDHRRTLIFAVFVGLSLGIGIAFLRDRLDRGIRGRDDLEEHVGAPALGIIPLFGSRF
jgi:uncharacterized protein involved in exopolysaccharide biosynthesis